VGKGALLRAVPTGLRPLVGTLRFAHPTALPYDRNAAELCPGIPKAAIANYSNVAAASLIFAFKS
jgi:hypothetical protein